MSEFVDCDTATLARQIGVGNILAISGGRITRHRTGIILPVSHGYRVAVDLAANDTYTVRRVFVRSGKVTVKQAWTYVHADEVGAVAYEASCFRN